MAINMRVESNQKTYVPGILYSNIGATDGASHHIDKTAIRISNAVATQDTDLSAIYNSAANTIEAFDFRKELENLRRLLVPQRVLVKCKHCGQWAAAMTACVHCGAAVDPE